MPAELAQGALDIFIYKMDGSVDLELSRRDESGRALGNSGGTHCPVRQRRTLG